MTLESSEVIKPVLDDNEDTVGKEKSFIFLLVNSGASSDIPYAELQVLEDNIK